MGGLRSSAHPLIRSLTQQMCTGPRVVSQALSDAVRGQSLVGAFKALTAQTG